MNLGELGEFGFIDKLKGGAISRGDSVIKGIGDDCAVIKLSSGKALLITTDILVEDIHFIRDLIPPYLLGRKSMAVNISDIAAMGGIPREAVISAAIPNSVSVEFLESLNDGFQSIAREFEINIVGGDTSGSPDRLVINIALIGEAFEDEILYRSGAKPGDTIFLTGTVGSSAAGLDALLKGHTEPEWQNLIEAHNNPAPHIAAGRLISGLKLAHSLIDISDGLVSDLGHICDESGVGAVISLDSIPVSDSTAKYIRRFKLDFDKTTLLSGEDYILLGTMPPDSLAIARDSLKSAGCGFYPIGEITANRGIALREADGSIKAITNRGFDHFKKP
jgi:thiamine-monophosphate kinase